MSWTRSCLFLAYHLNLTSGQISGITLNGAQSLYDYPPVKDHAFEQEFLTILLQEHISLINPKEFLFETKGIVSTPEYLRNRVYSLLAYYKMESVY